MTYIFIALIYLIIGLALYGLIVWVTKKPKSSLATIAVCCISVYFYYIQSLEQHHLSFIPSQLNVNEIRYVSEESWGVGLPGDNETGLIEYKLPENVAKEISKEGINYFLKIQKEIVVNLGERRNDIYSEWHETPISLSEAWQSARYSSEEPVSNITNLSVENYLDRYGFSIPIDPNVSAVIDYAISEPGSYYSYGGGGGILIIIPSEQKAFYAYAG